MNITDDILTKDQIALLKVKWDKNHQGLEFRPPKLDPMKWFRNNQEPEMPPGYKEFISSIPQKEREKIVKFVSYEELYSR